MLLRQVTQKLADRRVKVTLVILAWGMLFILGSLPTWNKSYRNEHEVQVVSNKLHSLSTMTVAGIWFDAAIERWEPVLREDYTRFFPAEKQREELFLELARVANQNGIDPITLYEIPVTEKRSTGGESPDDGAPPSDNEDTSLLVEQFAVDPSGLPSTNLYTFRLMAQFDSDYQGMARFVEGLDSIKRALTIHKLDAEPGPDGLSVAMELDFYAQSKN